MQTRGHGLLVLVTTGCLVGACGGQLAPTEDDSTSAAASPARDAAPLDCAWLTTSNCWSRSLERARSCAPQGQSRGTFSRARDSCDYADGMHVSFDRPVPGGGDDPRAVGYTISRGADLCVEVTKRSGSVTTVKTPDGIMTLEYAFDGFVFTCPDGSTFASPSGGEHCNADYHLPAVDIGWSATDVQARASGATVDSFTLFDCD